MPARVRSCGALSALERPDDDVEPGRVVLQRLGRGVEPDRRDRVQVDARLGPLERPRPMMDVSAVQLAFVLGVQAITLRQEVLEGSGFRVENRSGRAVGRTEGLPTAATAVEQDLVATAAHRDLRREILEPVEPTGSLDGDSARGVEREEPDPGLAVTGDVG